MSFVDRVASQEEAARNDTQVELAKLYAHISAMPESAKKRKLMKQINKANNATSTPAATPAKHKRSKSLGDSIKVSNQYHRNIFKIFLDRFLIFK